MSSEPDWKAEYARLAADHQRDLEAVYVWQKRKNKVLEDVAEYAWRKGDVELIKLLRGDSEPVLASEGDL